jgi:hypothetical protein
MNRKPKSKPKKVHLNILNNDGAEMDATIVLVVGDLVEVDFRKRGADVLHLLIVGEQAVKLKKDKLMLEM